MKKLTLLITGIFIYTLSVGQSPSVKWSYNYGGTSSDKATSVIQTNDGGYIVVGYSRSNDIDVPDNYGGQDYWVLKLDSIGGKKWSKHYGGSLNDVATGIQQVNDGGYIIAGYTESNDQDISGNHGSFDFWIIRLDISGDTVWTKTYGGSGDDKAYSLSVTNDSCFVVTGYTFSNDGDVTGNNGWIDYWIIKINSFGDTLWTKTVGTIGWEKAYSINETIDNGLIIGGSWYSWEADDDAGLVKLNKNGDVLWSKSFGSNIPDDRAYSVIQSNDTGFLVAGFEENICGNVIKTDSTGIKTWKVSPKCSWTPEVFTRLYSIDQIPDGSIFSAGEIEAWRANISDYKGGGSDGWVIKLFSDGNTLWSKCIGGSGDESLNKMILTSDGDMVIVGYSNSSDKDLPNNNGGDDFWVVKINGNWTPPVTLPFTEDWEAFNGVARKDSIFHLTTYSWAFKTNIKNQGRVRWGSNAYMSNSGSGALTLDKIVGNGSIAENHAIITLNLSNYIDDDIYLSFSWADHNDEEHAGDKVWVRGSENDEWVEIYDFDPQLFTDNAFHHVTDLDIDETLAAASPPQLVSSSFQLRFGQQDNYWANHDGITIDDIVISDEPLYTISAVTLPFVEDWEAYNGEQKTDTVLYFDTYSWAFETDVQNQGRARWGTDAYMANNSDGALTLDKVVGNGSFAVNHAILTLDLWNYISSTDLEMSFYWADHNDEEHPGDKVMIRGSLDDEWIELVNLNPETFADNEYKLVEGLDLDAVLANASPSQTVGETFQVCFSQEDNYWANYDGISFDDIVIEDNSDKSTKPVVIEEEKDKDINIYYTDGFINIRSNGKAITEEKHVQVYDLFGRLFIDHQIPPGTLQIIKVLPCSCYLVVKVLGNNSVSVEKVFAW